MADNTDLAVLGFQVKTANADAAFRKVVGGLETIENKVKDVDTAIEQNVTKAMTDLGLITRQMNATANALQRNKGVFDAFDSFKTFADNGAQLKEGAQAVKEAIELMSNARLAAMSKNLAETFKQFEAGERVVHFLLKVKNPEILDQLQEKLVIKVDDRQATALETTAGILQKLQTGLVAKLVPNQASLNDLEKRVENGIKPKISFDEQAPAVVSQMYKALNDAVAAQKDPIKIPFTITFGAAKSDIPKEAFEQVKAEFRESRKNLYNELIGDRRAMNFFGGKNEFQDVWEKAITGGPRAYEKMFTALTTSMEKNYTLEDAKDSMTKAGIAATEFGKRIELGVGAIPQEVAAYIGNLSEQLKRFTADVQESAAIHPTVAKSTQSDEDIKKVIDDLASRVQKVAKKEFNSLPIPIESVTLRPNNVLVSPVDAKTVFFATESIDADIKEAVLRPKSIKIDASAIPEGKTQLVGGEAFTAASKQISIPVPSVFIKPQNLLVSPLADEVAFLGESIAADVKETVLYPDKITIDASVLEQKNIKVTPDMLKASVKGVVGTTKSITIDTTAIPSDKITTVGDRLNVNVNEVLVHPKNIKVDAAFVNPDNVSLINGDTIADALQREPLKITTKIKLDPLPKDEIDKLDKLVSRLYDVERAYSNIQTVAARLRDTVKDLDAAMSAEVKALIKSGVSNAGILMKEKKQAEREEKKQLQEAQHVSDLWEAMNKRENFDEISEKRMAESRKETAAIMDNARNLAIVADLDKQRADEFAIAEDAVKRAMDGVTKTLADQKNEVKDGVEAAKASGEAYRKHTETVGRLRLAFNDLNPQLTQFNRQTTQLTHIEKLNIADPFKKLKAELGDTNSRLVDIARSFGLYFSGRMIVGYFRQASESANAFGMEIRRIQSLATNFDFSNLREQLMDIDARFGNVIHNANALYWAYSSGVRGSEEDLVRFTEVMSKTATTIKSDIMPTVDAATSIMNAWNLSAGSAKEIGDLLFSVIKYGKSNASQLTTSLGHVVAPAAALNLELDELGATIATLTKTMKTNRALTYLSNILGKMASPTEKVKEAAAEFGIELSANAIKARGFAQTLRDIREATGGDVAKIARLFPDLRGQRAAITLLGTQYKDFEQQLGNMRDKAGSMEEALSKIADTPDAQLRALKNTWQMLAIEVGAATNNLLTFGGALTPLMKALNGMEHTGRTITGNLIAAAGAWGGMYLMSRTLQAAQYAMAQSAFMMAEATTEVAKNELTIALNKQEAALQDNRMAVSELKTVLAAREYNDTVLTTLKNKQQILKTEEEQARLELATAKQRMKLEDTGAQRQLTADMLNIGQARSRLTALNALRSDFSIDASALNERNIANLLRRLQADVIMRRSRVQVGAQDLIDKMMDEIRPLVENQDEYGKDLRDALEKGNIEGYNKFKELIGNVVNTVKQTTTISSALKDYDNQDEILDTLKEQLAVGVLQKNLTSGEVYQHQTILALLDDQISKEKTALSIMEDKAKTTKMSLGMDSERIAQANAIAEQEAYVAELTRSRVELEVMIRNRSESLTGSLKNQIGLLEAAAKLAKDRLDNDTRNVENLKANAQNMLKQASMIGRETLAATQEYVQAQLQFNALSMEQQAIETQIKQLVDSENKLIVDTAENQAKYNKLLADKASLEERSVAAAAKMLKLGALAGDVKSRNTIIANYLGTDEQLVSEIARKKGVVSEAMRKMSSEVGKSVFGGRLGGRGLQSLSMLSAFVPGLGRWGMAASMAGSLNVVGNTAKGLTWFTGSMMGLLGTTERLQKKGILAMKTNLEDLTRVIMQGSAWLPRFALAEKQLMALRKAGASRQALASFATTATWLTAGVGTAIITAIAAGLWYALSKTEKGGPFGEVMEKFYGVDDKERYGRYLGIRLEQLRNERVTNAEMQRETRRMIEIAEKQGKDRQKQLELTRQYSDLTDTLHKLETVNAIQRLKNDIDAIADVIKEYRRLQEEMQGIVDTAGSRMDDSQRKRYEASIAELEAKISAERARRAKAIRAYKKQEKVLWQGYADATYNSLMELMESDRDAAFAPLLDGKRKLELAEKSVTMARKRLASVLSKESETSIKDIEGMSADAINDLIHAQIKRASDALQLARKNLEQARKDAEGGETKAIREEAKAKISDLEQAETNAQSKLDKVIQDLRAAMNDVYSRSITRADASVEETLERVKKSDLDLKAANLKKNADLTFTTVSNKIEILNEGITRLVEDYTKQVGIFSEPNAELRERIFKGELKKLTEPRLDQQASRVNMLKSNMENMASFIESVASETLNLEKSLFEFRMGNRAYTYMRPSLIEDRMEMLNNVLGGDKGLYALVNSAMDTMRQRLGVKDFAGATKALEDAKKYGIQARGIEEEKLDLIKRQADIERDINGSLYQLANTLRGQFAVTSQQAVEADSVEALRLMSRQFGDNIAPPIVDSYQEKERRYREERMAQDREFYKSLTTAATTLQTRLREEAENAKLNDKAAETMKDAATRANTAADTFQKAVESSKTILQIKRI